MSLITCQPGWAPRVPLPLQSSHGAGLPVLAIGELGLPVSLTPHFSVSSTSQVGWAGKKGTKAILRGDISRFLVGRVIQGRRLMRSPWQSLAAALTCQKGWSLPGAGRGAPGPAEGEPSHREHSRLPSPGTAGPHPLSSGRATQLRDMKSELVTPRF